MGRLESDLEGVEDEIAEIEARFDDETKLAECRAEINDEIEALRTKIDRVESQAVEAFNEHMDSVLNILEYRNLERIWLERVERDDCEG